MGEHTDTIILDDLPGDPASPENGEVWRTGGRLKARLSGVTVFLCASPESTCFGDHYQDFEDEAVVVTTSNTYSNRVDTTFNVPTVGRYRLDWQYIWNHDAATNDYESQILVDGTQRMHHRQEPKDSAGNVFGTGTNQEHRAAGFVLQNYAATGTTNIQLQHRTQNNGVESSTWEVRLCFYKVSD